MAFVRTILDSLALPIKNLKLYSFLYVTTAALFAGLLAWHALAVVPLAVEIHHRLDHGIHVDLGFLAKVLLVGGLFVLVFLAVLGKLSVLVFYAAAATHNGEDLGVGELLARARAAKEPLITVYLAYWNYFLYILIIGVLGYFGWTLAAGGGIIWTILLSFFIFIFFIKFVAIFMAFSVGVVISVLDHTVYGTQAFEATRTVLVKKVTALGLSFFFFVLYFAVNLLYFYALIAGYKYGLVLLAVLLAVGYVLVAAWFFIFVFNAPVALYYISVSDGEAAAYASLSAGGAAVV